MTEAPLPAPKHLPPARPRLRALGPDARAALLLALAVVAQYALALRNVFAYDDVPIIERDPRVHSLGRIPELLTQPYWGPHATGLGIWRPLTNVSFALDWAVSGGSPPWFHFLNLVWHLAVCWLAYRLLLRLFAAGPALFGALVFAVHPVHVEAVANVVGRAELMAAAAVLGACLVWTRLPDAHATPGDVAAAASLYLLGLLSKESAAVLPALLLLLDFAIGRWDLRPARLRAYLRVRGRALAALAATFGLYLAARLAVLGRVGPGILDPTLEVLHGRGLRMITALQAWPIWLRLALFPRTLLVDYAPRITMPLHGWTPAALLGLVLLTALLGIGAAALVARRRRAVLALLWFPTAILPVSNLIIPVGVLVAERTLYLPFFALSLGAAALAEAAVRAPLRLRRPALAAGILVLLALGVRSALRVPEWEGTNRIFEALVRDRPDAFRGHWHLARMARVDHADARSAAEYARAIALWPYREHLIWEAADLSHKRRHDTYALALARWGTEHWPRSISLYRVLAGSALDLGRPALARGAVLAGLRVSPADTVLARIGRSVGAPPPGRSHDS